MQPQQLPCMPVQLDILVMVKSHYNCMTLDIMVVQGFVNA